MIGLFIIIQHNDGIQKMIVPIYTNPQLFQEMVATWTSMGFRLNICSLERWVPEIPQVIAPLRVVKHPTLHC